MARPSEFNQITAKTICDRLACGESLRGICTDSNMPDRTTVNRWADQDEDFAASIARAREAQADYMDDRILEISEKILTGEIDPNAGRVAIAAFQWRAGKLKPKKYGDSMTLKGDKENPLDIGLAALLDAKMAERLIAPVLDADYIDHAPEPSAPVVEAIALRSDLNDA